MVAFQGHGKALGVGKRSGLVRISGHFVLPAPIELNDATVTITEPLDEVDGVGELTGDMLPVTLTAGPGSKRNRGFYRTRPGKQLSMSMEIKTRHHRRGLMEFSIMLDRATMSVGPARCAGGPRRTTRFETCGSVPTGWSWAQYFPGSAAGANSRPCDATIRTGHAPPTHTNCGRHRAISGAGFATWTAFTCSAIRV